MNEELMKFLDAAGLTQLWNEVPVVCGGFRHHGRIRRQQIF